MDNLKKARKPLRAILTKTSNELANILNSETPDMLLLEVKLENLVENFQKLDDVDLKILDLVIDESDDIQNLEYIEVENYKEKYKLIKLKVERFLAINNEVENQNNIPGSDQGSPSARSGNTSVPYNGVYANRNVKYPKIILKKFDGNLKEWLGFWSQFKLFHEDENIAISDKFQYLAQSMVKGSKAQLLVESYPQIDANYEKVIEALKRRFGRDDLLVEVYVRELLKLVITNTKQIRQGYNLSKMYDTLESYLRSLESLGVTSDKCAAMLFPLVESSLPEEILRAWERSNSSTQVLDDNETKLTRLMSFLCNEVESEERINLARCGFGTSDMKSKTRRDELEEEKLHTVAGLHVGNEKALSKSCIFCDGSHQSDRCLKAQSLSLEDKKKKIMNKKCCFCCFGPHMAKFCKAAIKCPLCAKKHYIILCPQLPAHKVIDEIKSKSEVNVSVESVDNNLMTTQTKSNQILLQTVLVKLIGKNGSKIARLMFDTGAQKTYIKENVAASIDVPIIGQELLTQTVFGGITSSSKLYNKYQLNIESLNGKNKIMVEALGQKIISGQIPRLTRGVWLKELSSKGIWINDMSSTSADVDILIGSDYYGKLITGLVHQLNYGLTAFHTLFGWTIIGSIHKEQNNLATQVSCNLIHANISDLWRLETLGITDPVEVQSKEEKEKFSKEHFQQTVKINGEGRYEVSLPWIVSKNCIPDNTCVAIKRLASMTKRLQLSNRLHEYHTVLQEWIANGLIESVPEKDLCKPGHYLPHRPVFKDNSTTPVRPVFDASAKARGLPSLNDCLEKGPNLLELIPSIILKFREKQIGVIADICKAFMMIAVCEEDKDFLRFLWWDSENAINQKEFRHTRVVFGVNCSPYLLSAVLDYHLTNVPREYEDCANILKTSLYVDNCITSVNSVAELQLFREQAVELLASAKMDLRMWESNVKISDSNQVVQNKDTKVLGLKWDKFSDTLSCDIPLPVTGEVLTKRIILSTIQKIFDPMGILSPALLVPKLYIQEAWVAKLGWDAELPEDLCHRFQKWLEQLQVLEDITVPRWMTGGESSRDSWSLHVFCDASQKAYAAVVFLRCAMGGTYNVQLLLAKSRVSPLKKITIPRLELLGCVIGVRLADSVKKGLNFINIPTFYWTDSSTVIAWIKGRGEWGVFVCNRVSEILKSSKIENWRYVPGVDNPADLPSRGCTPSKLLEVRWWEGPNWLRQSEETWRESTPDVNYDLVNQELKKSVIVNTVNEENFELPWYGVYSSKYSRIVRTVAWMKRFVNNARGIKISGELLVEEIEKAEILLLKTVQKDSFTKKLTCTNLQTLVDNDGLIRVVTKISRRNDTFEFRYPVLLPAKHLLVDVLIRETHLNNCHAGVQWIMSNLREKFWILQSRKSIRRIKEKCTRCKRYMAKSCSTVPAPLPLNRVQDASVFQVVGIDLAGPLYLRDQSKAWILLVTCAVYRAVHLELITSLSTEAFIQGFRRFIARRGRPSIVYSDNGTNFVGTENAFRALDWTRIVALYSTHRIQWKFNPPTAAWWGGWWERMIQTVKRLLIRVLGKSLLKYEELMTILCDIEAIVNSRPLTYVSEDANDLKPLTPSSFLQDVTDVNVVDLDQVENIQFAKRYRYIRTLRNDLRSRFRKEYISQLAQYHKENHGASPQVNDVVIVGSDNKKRFDWPLAKVINVYPGQDGHVRVVRLKTAVGEITRPIQRIYHLESRHLDLPDHSKKNVPDASSDVQLPPVQSEKEDEVIPMTTRSGRPVKVPGRFLV